MRSRPTEPTAALAALISGNHGYVQRRASGEPLVVARSLGRAFAVAWNWGPLLAPPSELFGFPHGEILQIDAADGVADEGAGSIIEINAALSAPGSESVDFGPSGVALIVALVPMRAGVAERAIAWHQAEARVFDAIAKLLATSIPARSAVVARTIRIVGAIVADADGRVHWIGEHPEQVSLLAQSREEHDRGSPR